MQRTGVCEVAEPGGGGEPLQRLMPEQGGGSPPHCAPTGSPVPAWKAPLAEPSSPARPAPSPSCSLHSPTCRPQGQRGPGRGEAGAPRAWQSPHPLQPPLPAHPAPASRSLFHGRPALAPRGRQRRPRANRLPMSCRSSQHLPGGRLGFSSHCPPPPPPRRPPASQGREGVWRGATLPRPRAPPRPVLGPWEAPVRTGLPRSQRPAGARKAQRSSDPLPGCARGRCPWRRRTAAPARPSLGHRNRL